MSKTEHAQAPLWTYGQAAAQRAEEASTTCKQDEFADEHDDYLRTEGSFHFFDERGERGQLTGSTYKRCIACGAEMSTGMTLTGDFVHGEDCPEDSTDE